MKRIMKRLWMKRLWFVPIIFIVFITAIYGGWDNTLPADNTPWNDAAGKIRDNWDALEVALGVDLVEGNIYNVYNVQNPTYGATGDGTTDDRSAINSAATAADGDTLYFPPGTYKISSDLTIGSTVAVVMANGAKLSPDSGVTVTLSGPFSAGLWQIKTGSGAIVFSGGAVHEVFPEWFGDGTDYGVMISEAIDSIEDIGGKIVFSQVMTATTGVDCTDHTSGILFEGRSSAQGSGGTAQPSLTFTMNGGVAFDCTGSAYVTFRDWTMDTDDTTYPAIGVLLARTSDGAKGAAGHTFINFSIDWNAKFSTAALYIYGCEELDFYACQFSNKVDGTATVIITGTNISSVSSSFATIVTGTQSTTGITFMGGKYVQKGTTDSDLFRLDGCADIHWFGGFWNVAAASTRSFVTFDGVGGAISYISFDGIRGEVGNDPTTAFRYVSSGAVTSLCHSFTNLRLDVATDFINADANTKLMNFTVHGVRTASTSGIVCTNMEESEITLWGMTINISGTSTQNIIKGDLANITIGTRTNDIIYNYTRGDWDSADSYVALADSATPSIAAGGRLWVTGGTTTITDITGGRDGQDIRIQAIHSVTITDGTNIFLSGSANWAMTATDTLTLTYYDGKWYEDSRGDNGA